MRRRLAATLNGKIVVGWARLTLSRGRGNAGGRPPSLGPARDASCRQAPAMFVRSIVIAVLCVSSAFGWSMSANDNAGSRRQVAQWTAKSFALAAGLAAAPLGAVAETTASGMGIKRLEEGKGAPAKMGDIVCVRFRGMYKNNVIDDIFKAPEPYFYRIGSGQILPGIDEALQIMRIGDRWELTLPAPLAFGPNGKRAAPGRPAIPPNAELVYEVLLESIPGKEDEVIMLDDE